MATRYWIADFRRLLDRCSAEADSTYPADSCTAFDVMFGLLDKLDAGERVCRRRRIVDDRSGLENGADGVVPSIGDHRGSLGSPLAVS